MTDALTSDAVMTLTEVAAVLKLCHQRGSKKGQPDRRLAVELVHAGKLRLIDPDQPVYRWSVSTAEVLRYIGGAA
jgi:hypothetical protein